MSIRYTAARIGRAVYRLAMSMDGSPTVHRVTSPSRFWRRIGRRFGIGHRAAFLLVFGLIFVTLGFGIILSPAAPNPLLFHTLMPVPLRVALWCGSGAVAMGVARSRWQWIGFVALAPPPIERFVSYAAAIVRDLLPGGGPPIPWPYLNGALLYLLVLFVTRLVASWPDPPADDL